MRRALVGVMLGGLALAMMGCGGGTSPNGGAARDGDASSGDLDAGEASDGSAAATGDARDGAVDVGGANDGAAETGGGDGGGCAPNFTPCGGDVVGTWRALQTCNPIQPTRSLNGCPGEMFDLTGVESTAIWTFGADHSFTITISAQGSATVSAPTACLIGSNGMRLSCDDDGAGAMYAARIVFTGGKAGAPTCMAAADACQCTIPFAAAPVTSNNSYSTSGTTLTVVQSGGSNALDYCVSGNTLDAHIRLVAGSAGDVNFVRQ